MAAINRPVFSFSTHLIKFLNRRQKFFQPKKVLHLKTLIFLIYFLVIHPAFSTFDIPGGGGITGGGAGVCPGNNTNPCSLCGDVNKSGAVDQVDLAVLKGYAFGGSIPPEKFCNANVNKTEDGNYPLVDIGDVIRWQAHFNNGVPLECATAANVDTSAPRLNSTSATGQIRLNGTEWKSCMSIPGNNCYLIPGLGWDNGATATIRINADDFCPPVYGVIQSVIGVFTGGVQVQFTAESASSYVVTVTSSFFSAASVIILTDVYLTDNSGNSSHYINGPLYNDSPLDGATFAFLLPSGGG